jgi:hypothetical protein
VPAEVDAACSQLHRRRPPTTASTPSAATELEAAADGREIDAADVQVLFLVG